MVSEEAVVERALALPDVTERQQSVDGRVMRVFSRGERIFTVVHSATAPLRVELRCDVKLSRTLQERYESVMESRALGRGGIEIVCSGQLTDDEILDLVRHGYEESA